MKKLLSFVLTLAMLLSCCAVIISARDVSMAGRLDIDDTFALGDVNDDGDVNAKDAVYLKANILGLEGYDYVLDATDFDCDGEVSSKDMYYLKRCLASLATPADYGDNKAVAKFSIAGTDVADMCIVVPEGTSDESNIWCAYRLLYKYVKAATGVEMPVVFGTATTEKAVYFNHVELNSARGEELGIEGYKYEVSDGNLSVWGTYRGNMYAIYEILEEYLGFRFVNGDETFVYKNRSVDIPEGTSVEHVPYIGFRMTVQYLTDGCHEAMFFANRLNGTQLYSHGEPFYGTQTGPQFINAHSFGYYWAMATGTMPPEDSGLTLSQRYDLKKRSGEVKNELQWNPCASLLDSPTSDYAILFQGLRETTDMLIRGWGREMYIEEGITSMSFSICDNQNYHTCRYCRLMSQGNKNTPAEGYSGLYVNMVNRAAIDIQEYYPGLKLYTILYNYDIPATIRPNENVIIMYCGSGCHNHILGREECYEGGGQLDPDLDGIGLYNKDNEEALIAWGQFCKDAGTEMWYWVYPVTYHYYLCGCPNVPNMYWDMRWLIDNANITGFYYEGGGRLYSFEALKAYVSTKVMWDPDMTYEEFTDILKEFLYIYYGEGYNELYEYILMQTEAGDQCGTCFINNFDRPGDMYSYDYLAEHYEEMRGLLLTALDKAKNDKQRGRIETLLVCCDFMGLSSVYDDMYTNGDSTSRALYEERYTWMYEYIRDHDMDIFSSDIYVLPSTCDFSVNPMTQYYEEGSRRPGIYP